MDNRINSEEPEPHESIRVRETDTPVVAVLAAAFIAGVLLGEYVKVTSALWLVAACAAGLGTVLSIKKTTLQYLAALTLFAVLTSAFLMAADRYLLDNTSLESYVRTAGSRRNFVQVTARVMKAEDSYGGSKKITAAAEAVLTPWGGQLKVRGVFDTYIDGFASGDTPGVGERWLFRGYLTPSVQLKPRVYMRNRIEGVSARLNATALPRRTAEASPYSLMAIGGRVRERFETILRTNVRKPYSDVLICLALGKSSEIDPEIVDSFQKAGLAHLLVVSGMNVTFLIGMVLFMRILWREKTWLGVMLVTVVLLLHFAMTGGGPSILRATIMGFVFIATLSAGMEYAAWVSLCIAALAMVAIDPSVVFSLSAQLSFFACAGVVLIYPRLSEYLPQHPGLRKIMQGMIMAIAAQLPLYPILAWHFNQVNIIAPVSNLIIVPVAAALYPLDLLTCIAGLIPGPLVRVFAYASQGVAWFMLMATDFFAQVKYSNIPTASPDLWWIVLFEIMVVIVTWLLYKGKRGNDGEITGGILAAGLCGAILIAAPLCKPPLRDVRATFIDVGEGDATLVEIPAVRRGYGVYRMLVDGGGAWGDRAGQYDPGKYDVGRLLARRGIRSLDSVVVTHPDADHMNGLLWVLGNIKVGTLFAGVPEFSSVCADISDERCRRSENVAKANSGAFTLNESQTEKFRKLISIAHRRGVAIETIGEGYVIDFDSGARVKFISPSQDMLRQIAGRYITNSTCLVAAVTFGKGKLLLTADIDAEAEKYILRHHFDEVAGLSLLKVPHHGSRWSLARGWVSATAPQIAVISTAGPSRYGHPHETVTTAYSRSGAAIFRTDTGGTTTCLVHAVGHAGCVSAYSDF